MFQQLVTLSSAISPGIILQVPQDVGLTAKRLKSNEVGREKMAHWFNGLSMGKSSPGNPKNGDFNGSIQ